MYITHVAPPKTFARSGVPGYTLAIRELLTLGLTFSHTHGATVIAPIQLLGTPARVAIGGLEARPGNGTRSTE